MKQKRTGMILALAFVLLLGAASFLYTRLGEELAPEALAIEGGEAVKNPPKETEEAAPEAEGEAVAPDMEEEAAAPAEEEPGTPETEEESPVPEPVPAPDFTVYDKDGNEVHLTDYAGKPVVLNFWASWCGPCRMEMPHFQEAYVKQGEEVHFLMVNMIGGRESRESADKFLAESGYTFPVLYDTDSDAAIAYSAYSLPTTYFIDAEGRAIARASGAIDAETLQMGIDMIL